ncbi:MAG: hypothetical protein JWL75_709 [Parcubacteria group bacterium]|nr:hypothetical protein [Parcubacteria group bacterium]
MARSHLRVPRGRLFHRPSRVKDAWPADGVSPAVGAGYRLHCGRVPMDEHFPPLRRRGAVSLIQLLALRFREDLRHFLYAGLGSLDEQGGDGICLGWPYGLPHRIYGYPIDSSVHGLASATEKAARGN